jgi:lipoprotein-anchoring transpeptidase ErfK/SrfK
MTSPKATLGYRSSCAIWIVVLISVFMLTMIAGATLAMSPGLVRQSLPAPTTAVPVSWASVQIAKPTYTPSPVPIPTSTPTLQPTAEPTLPPVGATQSPIDTTQSPLQMSIVPTAAVAYQDVQSPSGGKYILVSISDQHLSAYENGQIVYSFVASTGMRNSTRVGKFSVLDKIPNAYGSTWNIWMPDWLGIYYSGTLENGIHALPILSNGNRLWAGFLGTPISFGCVVLGSNEALQLYNWADVGTPVEIRW